MWISVQKNHRVTSFFTGKMFTHIIMGIFVFLAVFVFYAFTYSYPVSISCHWGSNDSTFFNIYANPKTVAIWTVSIFCQFSNSLHFIFVIVSSSLKQTQNFVLQLLLSFHFIYFVFLIQVNNQFPNAEFWLQVPEDLAVQFPSILQLLALVRKFEILSS